MTETIPKLEITATVVIIHENKTLLHLHKQLGVWMPIGGHVEENEPLHEAAHREVMEEAGIEIEIWQQAPLLNWERSVQVPCPFLSLFHTRLTDRRIHDNYFIAFPKSLRLRASDGESTTFRWVTADDLRAEINIWPDVRTICLNALELVQRE